MLKLPVISQSLITKMILKILLILLLPFLVILLLLTDLTKITDRQNLSNLSFEVIKKKKEFKAGVPTVEQIFAKDHLWVATLSAERKRVLIATGDVIPARAVNYQVVSLKKFSWPYENIAEVLKSADVTFINLETPLISNCPSTQVGMIFCGDSRNVEGLVYSGIDVASLANNHAANYGEMGVSESVNLLEENGISVTGVNGPKILDIRGVKFAFLGYNDISKNQPGVSNALEEKIRDEITLAKSRADVVVVTYHWGAEYRDQPDERQIYLGHLTIEAGADLVVGNHPHWIQPIEIYKGKLITYAHGNLIFDQEWSQKTKEGVIGKYTFYDNQLIDVEFLPVFTENYGQAKFLEGEKKEEILNRMKDASEGLIKVR